MCVVVCCLACFVVADVRCGVVFVFCFGCVLCVVRWLMSVVMCVVLCLLVCCLCVVCHCVMFVMWFLWLWAGVVFFSLSFVCCMGSVVLVCVCRC